VFYDDPEHAPFLLTPDKKVYRFDYFEFEKLLENSENFIKYSINEDLLK